jgi:cytochrome P450
MDISTQVRTTSSFDPFGQPFLQNPAAYFETLTDQSPALIDMLGVPSAYVARHDQVVAVLRDPKRFSSVKPRGLPGMEKVDFFNGLPVMNYSDDPVHARLRRLVQPAFSPRRAQAMVEAAKEIAAASVDRIGGRDSFEIMDDLTKPLSIELLMGRFMGVSRVDWPIFLDYLDSLKLLQHVAPGEGKPAAVHEAWQRGAAYCNRAAARARAGEGRADDLIRVLVDTHDAEDGRLSDDELMAMMVLLFIGGVNTVAGAVGGAVLNLARYPALAERVRQDPTAASKVFEETLRMEPTVLLVMRFATEDVCLGEVTIPAGTPVYIMLSAASNDARVFPKPQTFDIDRPNLIEHLGFGRGIHGCIGSPLARAIAPHVLQMVAQRFPRMRLDDPESVRFDAIPRARHLASAIVSID